MKPSVSICACAVLVLSGICAALPAVGGDSDKKLNFSATDVKETGRRAVLLDGSQVSVVAADGTRRVIQVKLSRVLYQGTVNKCASSGVISESGIWHCYELESRDKGVPYSWSYWSGSVLGLLKLITTADGTTYLTWVEGSTLCFADVSRPMDESEKMKRLDERLNSKKVTGVHYVDVSGPIGLEQFTDENSTGHNSSIHLMSLENDGNGGFRLQLHGFDASKVYTLVTDKEAESGWRLDQ